MTSLGELLAVRKTLEDKLEEQEGVITEELEKVWDDNNTAIEKKIDSYVHVIRHLESIAQMMKEREEQIATVRQRATNEVRRIKQRLNFLSGGERLYGEEYKVSPITSQKRQVDIDKVEPEYVRLTLQTNLLHWNYIREMIQRMGMEMPGINEKVIDGVKEIKRDVLVSELPKDHPAITSTPTHSIRIT